MPSFSLPFHNLPGQRTAGQRPPGAGLRLPWGWTSAPPSVTHCASTASSSHRVPSAASHLESPKRETLNNTSVFLPPHPSSSSSLSISSNSLYLLLSLLFLHLFLFLYSASLLLFFNLLFPFQLLILSISFSFPYHSQKEVHQKGYICSLN